MGAEGSLSCDVFEVYKKNLWIKERLDGSLILVLRNFITTESLALMKKCYTTSGLACSDC